MKNPDPRREIRRQNAKKLAASVGSQAEFGRKTGMSDSQITQNLGDKPTKNIGNIVAQRIEKAFNLPPGWLDLTHETPHQPNADSVNQAVERIARMMDWIGDDEAQLLSMYRTTDDIGREKIMETAKVVPKKMLPRVVRHNS